MKTKILLFFGMLLISTSIFSQTVTCYDEPDMPGVFIKTISLDENTLLDSVIVYFENVMADFEGPANDDWTCKIIQLKNDSIINPWDASKIDTSLYKKWIDLTHVEYEGAIKLEISTHNGIEWRMVYWDSVCIATSPKESIDSTDLDTVITSITSYNISGESKTKSGIYNSKNIIIDNDTNILTKIDSIYVSCDNLDSSLEDVVCEIIDLSNQSLIEDLYLSSNETWYDFQNSYQYVYNDSISLKVNIPKDANLQCDSIYVATTTTLKKSYFEAYEIKKKVLDSINNIASLLVGFDELKMNVINKEYVTVYPVPSDNFIYLKTNNLLKTKGFKVKIMNTLGAIVFEEDINEQLFSINSKTLGNNGLYYVQVINESGEIIDVKKIILE